MADLDLHKRGGWGKGRSSRPWGKGWGAGLQHFFPALLASVWSINKGERPPGHLPCICHCLTTIGDKIVETLYLNGVILENKTMHTPPHHSKLGYLLFSTGSSNSGIYNIAWRGWEKEKPYLPLLKSVESQGPLGKSVSTNSSPTVATPWPGVRISCLNNYWVLIY